MPHAMILYKSLPDEDYLERLVADGTLRAAAKLPLGPYAGFGISSGETASHVMSTTASTCPGSIPDCIHFLLDAIDQVQSPAHPAEFNLFALLDIAPGGLERFAAEVEETGPPPDGVEQAVTFAYGARDISAVVEVVGDDLRAVRRRLHALVDKDYVRRIETLVVSRDQAYGWGSELASIE